MSDTVQLPELPDLDSTEHAYVLARQEGKNKSDSIRAAKDTSNWSNPAIWTEAQKMERRPHVRLWLDHIKREQLSSANYTLDEHVKELDELKELSKQTGNMGAAANCLVSKGKAMGHYVERHQEIKPDMTEEQLINQAIELIGALAGQDLAEMAKERIFNVRQH